MGIKLYSLILLTILIVTSIFIETGKASASSLPTVYISPSSQTVKLGRRFSVGVDLDNASNLYGYEIWLSFNSSRVNATAIEYDGYLNPPPYLWAQTINNTGGYVDFAVSSLLPAQPKSGGSPPPLVTINFTAIALGTSPLHLNQTKTSLVSSLNGGTAIPHYTSDGNVTIVPPLPKVYVSPSSQTVKLGRRFSVGVDLDNASNLYGYEIWLSFNSSRVNATAIEYDGYLNPPPYLWAQTINNTGGYVDFAVSSLLPAQPKSGGSPPPLVTINFTAIALGTSPLHLNQTKTSLVSSLNGGTAILYTTSGGTVTVIPLVHDVAATGIHPAHRFLGKGFAMGVNVTVQNRGDYKENFNVSLCVNLVVYATQAIILSSGKSANITFGLITTDFALGNCTISAYAWPVPGQTNLTNNYFPGLSVQITKVGDFGGYPSGSVVPQFGYFDGSCGPDDIPLFIQCYRGTAPAQWEYLGDLGGYPSGSVVPQFFLVTGSCGPVDIPLFIQCYRGTGPV
jgi:hypothetical protein